MGKGKMAERGKGKEDSPQETKKGSVNFSTAIPASIEEVVGRTGTRGEATQVRCKILEGREASKIMIRNVKGPVQLGDVLMLRETEIEAKALTRAGRGSK